ncbi:MAG: Uma2 family endonuclease [Pseudomonadota bacterium]
MIEHVPSPSPDRALPFRDREVPVTNAGEGMLRRAWTVKQVMAMNEAGIINENERFELIGGEVIPMNSKGIFHERLKWWLTRDLMRNLPDAYHVIPETTFYLADDTFVEPDLLIYPAFALEGLRGPDALLTIEISDSSLPYDLGRKAKLYASFGVRECWTINARTLTVTVHQDPGPLGYRRIRDETVGHKLRPFLVEGYSVNLQDFETA